MANVNKYAFSDKAQAILQYLRDNSKVDYTSNELADNITALGKIEITHRQMVGTLNSLVKKGFVERVEVDDNGAKVKVIRLTDDGEVIDLDMLNPKYVAQVQKKAKPDPADDDDDIKF